MAENDVGQLLHALVREEANAKLLDNLSTDHGGFFPTLRRAFAWNRSAAGIAGFERLVTYCQSTGRKFGSDWLAEQRAILHEEHGVSLATVDAISVAEFLEAVRGKAGVAVKSKRGRPLGSKSRKAKRPLIEADFAAGGFDEGIANRHEVELETVQKYRRDWVAKGKPTKARRGRKLGK